MTFSVDPNYGANKKSRIDGAIHWALIYSALFYIIFFAVLGVFPDTVLKVFNASDYMFSLGIPALRILAVAYFVPIPNLVFAASLQGLSLGTKSMYLTMMRQAILPVVFAFILRSFGALSLVWVSFVGAEVVGIPVAVHLWREARQNI